MLTLSGDTWKRWETKHKELAATGRWELAGLFHGHEGPGFRSAAKRVLYTGKATAGSFDSASADQDYFGCNQGAFWSFARRLSSLTGGDRNQLENVAWSNLCKIGTVRGNPSDALVDAQAALAIDTLRQEWVELRPTLVICAAEGYQEHLIYSSLGVMQDHGDGFEIITLPGGAFWKRSAVDGMPAFLWMKHPQGKPREYIEAAEALAQELLMQH